MAWLEFLTQAVIDLSLQLLLRPLLILELLVEGFEILRPILLVQDLDIFPWL